MQNKNLNNSLISQLTKENFINWLKEQQIDKHYYEATTDNNVLWHFINSFNHLDSKKLFVHMLDIQYDTYELFDLPEWAMKMNFFFEKMTDQPISAATILLYFANNNS